MQEMSEAVCLLDKEAVNTIEKNTDVILQDVGVRLTDDPESLATLEAAGFKVEGQKVRGAGGLLREIIRATAPGSFWLHARNPEHSTLIGGNVPIFAPMYGAPNVMQSDGSCKMGTVADYQGFVIQAQQNSQIGNTGHMICVMNDIPESVRHLKMAEMHLTHGDKPFMGATVSAQATQDVIDLTAAAFDSGTADDTRLTHLINSVPPLTYSEKMLGSLRVAARNNQACAVTSFMMMGATAPATLAGTLAQGYAEVLVGLALTQLYRPGAPCLLGIYGLPFSMRSSQPVFGDPVSWKAQLVATQLARHLGIPALGYGALTSSNISDAQAGSESKNNLTSAVISGADFILHATGWLESGRTVSARKFNLDADCLATITGKQRVDSGGQCKPLSSQASARFTSLFNERWEVYS